MNTPTHCPIGNYIYVHIDRIHWFDTLNPDNVKLAVRDGEAINTFVVAQPEIVEWWKAYAIAIKAFAYPAQILVTQAPERSPSIDPGFLQPPGTYISTPIESPNTCADAPPIINRERPTIDELEKMIASGQPLPFTLQPDGHLLWHKPDR